MEKEMHLELITGLLCSLLDKDTMSNYRFVGNIFYVHAYL